ncbi:MAG: hypothetical protein ACI8PZ_005560 [Myxococcota bacterium]
MIRHNQAYGGQPLVILSRAYTSHLGVSRYRTSRWIAVAVAMVLLACTDPAPSKDSGDLPAVEAVTTCPEPPRIDTLSEPDGVPLADGDTVTMVHGPQGGWHVGLSAVIRGSKALTLQPMVTRVDTGEALAGAENAFGVFLWDWDEETCIGGMQGMIAYLDDPGAVDQAYICGLVGLELDVRLSATDPETGAADEVGVRVIAALDPLDSCD